MLHSRRISTVPVEPGLTNAASEKNGERLGGFNTENDEINEGLVRFDLGSYEWKGNLDLLNIITLGLAKNLPEHDETYELHRLLGALLSKELTIDEKLNINGFTVEQIASQLPYRHMLNVWHKSSFKGTGVILYL